MMAEATRTPAMASVTELLFLHAQTALHPGSGTALGVVDLPIQRERHTQWPTIPGSSLKGVLRDACREQARKNYEDEYEQDGGNRRLRRSRRQIANEEDPMLVAAFGPGKVDENTSYAGALSVTDARILAFPVRSLCGVFAWVTCQAVLDRLNRDLKLAGLGSIDSKFDLRAEQAACADGSPLVLETDRLVLEEFEFRQTVKKNPAADWVARNAVDDVATRERLRSCCVMLSDDDFTYFARHATEVVARVALNYDTKTVKGTALFYQEFLPPETLFYSVVFANQSRRQGDGQNAGQIMSYLRGNIEKAGVIQIGGDETTGKGFCAAKLGGANGGVR